MSWWATCMAGTGEKWAHEHKMMLVVITGKQWVCSISPITVLSMASIFSKFGRSFYLSKWILNTVTIASSGWELVFRDRAWSLSCYASPISMCSRAHRHPLIAGERSHTPAHYIDLQDDLAELSASQAWLSQTQIVHLISISGFQIARWSPPLPFPPPAIHLSRTSKKKGNLQRQPVSHMTEPDIVNGELNNYPASFSPHNSPKHNSWRQAHSSKQPLLPGFCSSCLLFVCKWTEQEAPRQHDCTRQSRPHYSLAHLLFQMSKAKNHWLLYIYTFNCDFLYMQFLEFYITFLHSYCGNVI